MYRKVKQKVLVKLLTKNYQPILCILNRKEGDQERHLRNTKNYVISREKKVLFFFFPQKVEV